MKGEKWHLFCLQISFFGWCILAAIVPLFGTFLLAPYLYAAEAAFYLDRTGNLTTAE